MATLLNNFHKRTLTFLPTRPLSDDLPVSQTTRPRTKPASSFSASFRRSRSTGDLSAGPILRWWNGAVSWILSRKPTFARDLEMNDEESALIGFNNKGSLRHLLFKIRSELRRVVAGEPRLPVKVVG